MEKDNALGYQCVDIYNRDNYYQISRVNPLLIRYIERVQNKKALDIGCGNGIKGRYMLEMGYNVLGIDINDSAIRMAQANGLHAQLIDVRDFAWSDNYDLITILYSLQHLQVQEAIQVLNNAYITLNSNGLMIIGIFTDRENAITIGDIRLLLNRQTDCRILDEKCWEREDKDHGAPHFHRGFYCVCRKG